MTFEFPLWLGPAAGQSEGPPFGAQQYRQLVDLLFDEGVLNVGGGQLAVAPVNGLTLNVAPGAYVVDGDDVTGQGSFYGRNLAPGQTVTLAAAPGTGSRIDLIVVKVNDSESTGQTTNNAVPLVITGTSTTGTPAVPPVPGSAIPLAQVLVAAGTSTITSAMVTDLRTQAGAASLKVGTQVVPVTQAQRDAITSPFDGQAVYNTTLGALEAGDATTKTFASTRPLGLFFGRGLDGDVTITGTVTLTRDMEYRNLTVVAGAVLNTNGYRILATGTVNNAGTIACDGGAGQDGLYAAAFPSGSFTYSATAGGAPGLGGGQGPSPRRLGLGGDGGRGSFQYYDPSNGTSAYPGTAGLAPAPTYGGKGGDGGRFSSGTPANGDRGQAQTGAAVTPAPTTTMLFDVFSFFGMFGLLVTGNSAMTAVAFQGGGGGGGGGWGGSQGTNFTSRSGGGGGGGGVVIIIAETIINTGTITANGGKGGIGATNAGPGGGGGGGVIALYYRRLRETGTTSVLGGAAGTGTTTIAPAAGLPGNVYRIGV